MSIIDPNSKKPTGKSKKTGQFVAGNTFGFKKGKSGNPNGAPRKDEVLKALDAALGDVPRALLFKVLDQAANGTRHFKSKTPIAKAINRMGPMDVIKIATYLDEQHNGKAKQTTALEGAVIVLSEDADRL